MDKDVTSSTGELADSELVFALVSPLGTPSKQVQAALSQALKQHQYRVQETVRISDLLGRITQTAQGERPAERPAERQERLMDAGNKLRRHNGSDYLALMAIASINAGRRQDPDGGTIPAPRCAYIIRSLKHPDEVARLRHVYGKGFFLLGVSAPKPIRLQTLIEKNFQKDEAERLLEKDAAEKEKIGQQTRDTFELADAFLRIDGSNTERIQSKVKRIVDLLLSCPFLPPTREEHAMFMAYGAALRSSDLSRQVGAVIVNRAGDVIASGANDAPAPGGGTYWPEPVEFQGLTDEREGPDYLRGYDSNERERNKILAGVIQALIPDVPSTNRELTAAERASLVAEYKERLQSTGILDITEFGRAVHAEMAALLSCARSGVSPTNGTLFCTTFPCHNCAKHIIASGLKDVVYIEPYPKSKAKDLHADAISLPDEDEIESNMPAAVSFRAFEGIGPRRFLDLFSLRLGSGRPVRRKQNNADGVRVNWARGDDSRPRLPLDPRSYLEREDHAALVFKQKRSDHEQLSLLEDDNESQTTAAKNPAS